MANANASAVAVRRVRGKEGVADGEGGSEGRKGVDSSTAAATSSRSSAGGCEGADDGSRSSVEGLGMFGVGGEGCRRECGGREGAVLYIYDSAHTDGDVDSLCMAQA